MTTLDQRATETLRNLSRSAEIAEKLDAGKISVVEATSQALLLSIESTLVASSPRLGRIRRNMPRRGTEIR